MIRIIPYTNCYEKSWVYCKALAYLYSDFFDDPSRTKDDLSHYEEAIELIAVSGDTVVGLLDIGIYSKEDSRNYPYHSMDSLAYFVNLAVHPDYQNQGIASQLFQEAETILKAKKVNALAIFTRGDANANHLYQKWGARLVCEDYLVVGLPRQDKQIFQFQVVPEEKRLRFKTGEGELPYYQREGIYIVSQKENLTAFDCEAVYRERTYIKIYR